MNKKKETVIGVVVVTHGDFGRTIFEAAEVIMGPQDHCGYVSVDVAREVGDTMGAIHEAIRTNDSGSGVLVLTDLFGGSPTTMSLSLLKTENVEVVAGVNLPMVVKALQSRHLELDELAQEVRDAGIQGIVLAGELLRKRTAKK